MTTKWGCLTMLAAGAIAWNAFVWTTPDPPDVGASCLLIAGLAVIFGGDALARRTKRREPRGFPIEPKPRDDEP